MNHVYSKHIKNKQSQGFVVNGCIPFLKLYDAECYCMVENVPPDKDHLAHDPETAKTMALPMLWETKRQIDKLERDMVENKGKITICSERKKRFETIPTLGGKLESETCRDELNRLIARSDTLHDLWQEFHNRYWELYMITRLKGN